MNDVKCANCSTSLSNNELRDGWCNSCGKQVPMFVYHQAGLKGPKEKALAHDLVAHAAPTATMEPDDAPATWQLALIGLAILCIAIVIVYTFIWVKPV